MSTLNEIRERMETAANARFELHEDSDGSESIRAAFIAEQSSYDVPNLLEALEAVIRLTDNAQEMAWFGGAKSPGLVSVEAIRHVITTALEG